MTTDTTTKEQKVEAQETTHTTEAHNTSSPNVPGASGTPQRPTRRLVKNRRTPRRRREGERARPEFDQKILNIRRVTRVMGGGRRFSFSVAMAVGDKKGRVGVGVGKASDTALAIEKALRRAKKDMITVPRTEEASIPHAVSAKYAASEIMMNPAPGRGLVAGSAVRSILELGGVSNVSAKILSRSKNQINNAMAAIRALQKLEEKS